MDLRKGNPVLQGLCGEHVHIIIEGMGRRSRSLGDESHRSLRFDRPAGRRLPEASHQRGRAPTEHLPEVELFCSAPFKSQFRPQTAELDLSRISPQVLLEFVLQQGEHYPPGQLQSLASALRSFCRFLCVTGRHCRDLSPALPSISGHHREDLPRYLSRRQFKEVLEVFDRRTLLGKRDYAIALCLGRLGLRAGEAARLSLDDLDWHNGWLRLTAPKSRRERRLPLPEQVGQALTAYLRSAPPKAPPADSFAPPAFNAR